MSDRPSDARRTRRPQRRPTAWRRRPRGLHRSPPSRRLLRRQLRPAPANQPTPMTRWPTSCANTTSSRRHAHRPAAGGHSHCRAQLCHKRQADNSLTRMPRAPRSCDDPSATGGLWPGPSPDRDQPSFASGEMVRLSGPGSAPSLFDLLDGDVVVHQHIVAGDDDPETRCGWASATDRYRPVLGRCTRWPHSAESDHRTAQARPCAGGSSLDHIGDRVGDASGSMIPRPRQMYQSRADAALWVVAQQAG